MLYNHSHNVTFIIFATCSMVYLLRSAAVSMTLSSFCDQLSSSTIPHRARISSFPNSALTFNLLCHKAPSVLQMRKCKKKLKCKIEWYLLLLLLPRLNVFYCSSWDLENERTMCKVVLICRISFPPQICTLVYLCISSSDT